VQLTDSPSPVRPARSDDLAHIVQLQRELFPFMASEDTATQAAALSLVLRRPAAGAVIVLETGDRIDGAAVVQRRRAGPVVLESVCKWVGTSAGLRDRGVAVLFDAVVSESLRLAAGLGSPAVFLNSAHPSVLRGFHSAARRSGRLHLAGAFGSDRWYSNSPVSTWQTSLRHRSFVLRRWLHGEQVLDAHGGLARVSLQRLWAPNDHRRAPKERATEVAP
jgi:hypothetical protein